MQVPHSRENVKGQPEKRAAILDAALDLFAERGLHGTAVPLVAEKAKVGIGTIYRYFETKEALVNALYQEQKRLMAAAIQRDFPIDLSPREQFHVLWVRLVEFAREHPASIRFMELHYHQSYLDETSRKLEEQVSAWFAGLLGPGVELQVLKEGPPELFMALVKGAFVGMMRAYWDGRFELTEEILEIAEACCWEAIRG